MGSGASSGIDRAVAGVATLGLSEVARVVDRDAGEALGNFVASVNPITNAARAVAHTVVEGNASRLVEAVPGVRAVSDGTRALAVTTRGVPVLAGVTGAIDNVAVTEVGINALQALPLLRPCRPCSLAGQTMLLAGGPELEGWPYACAWVANNVYQKYASRPSSFTDREGDSWKEIQFGSGLETRDNDLISVFECEKHSAVIIAARGTADVSDLAADAEIVLGCLPELRCAEFETFVKKFFANSSRSYTHKFLTGHSLGGCIAIKVGKFLSFQTEVHAFNPGATLHDPISNDVINRACGYSKVVVHRIRGDLISQFVGRAGGVEVKVYNQGKFGFAHGIHQFL